MAKRKRTNLRVASCEDGVNTTNLGTHVSDRKTASARSLPTTPARPAKRSSRASFIMLWTAAVLATAAAFIVHLSMRFETIDLGYDVGAERSEQRRLIEECRLLSLEAAILRDSARVESVARGVLEMDVPSPDRVVPVLPTSAQRRTSGRVQ